MILMVFMFILFSVALSSSLLAYRYSYYNLLCGFEGNLPENVRDFSYNELRSATNNFHASNKIGRGGFGIVYKVITICIRFILVNLSQNLHHLYRSDLLFELCD